MKLSDIVKVRGRFLRSVNLDRDANVANALDGYIPTPTALRTLYRVMNSYKTSDTTRAWTLTGVYGTGKSAFANFLSAFFAPTGSGVRKAALKLLRSENSVSASASALARGIPADGLVRAIAVAQREPLANTIVRALAKAVEEFWANRVGAKPAAVHRVLRLHEELKSTGMVTATDLPNLVAEVASVSGTGVLLVIDELGKLLEYAAGTDRSADLYLLQQLAELPVSSSHRPVLLIGILHQAFSEYANPLSLAQRAEWEKIQGRFEDIPFAESTDQMLRLAAAAIENHAPPSLAKQIHKEAIDWHRSFKKDSHQRYLADTISVDQIGALFPLHPVAAIVLPLVCARYGQNERSLFTFLASAAPHALPAFLDQVHNSVNAFPCIRLPQIYDYFLAASITGSGSHTKINRWAEVHSAIAASSSLAADEVDALKAIGVLNLIGGIGALRASESVVIAALCVKPTDRAESRHWKTVLGGLVERRVITYRRQIDEYRIWEGTDFDIDGAVRDAQTSAGLSIADVLEQVAPQTPLIAQRHSYRTGTLRFFERRFADAVVQLDGLATKYTGSDGMVVYWVSDGLVPDLPSLTSDRKPIVIVQVALSRSLDSAARELLALTRVERENPALQTDGVARKEVRRRLVYARHILDEQLRAAIDSRHLASMWLGDEQLPAQSLNAALSLVCDRVYHRGPVLWNELLNRRELTSQGARAQRQLIEALLTRFHEANLGIVGNGPEFSMYDSLLRATGIHRPEGEVWVIGSPSFGGVNEVWNAIEDFCLSATHSIRPLSELYRLLDSPPYGAKHGLVPILLAAILLYHADDVSVYQDGSFLPILGPAHFELLTKHPHRFGVKHFALDGIRWEVFRELEAVLRSGGAKRPARARNATMLTVVRPLARFARELPPVTRNANDLSASARGVRDALLSVKEPDNLLFEALPAAVGFVPFAIGDLPSTDQHEQFRKALFNALRELQVYHEQLLDKCRAQIRSAFVLSEGNADLREDLRVRANYLVGKVIEPRLRSFILAAIDQEISGSAWLETVVMIIADRPADTWTADDVLAFEMNVTEMARRFINLEALQKDTVRTGLDGFEARRVTITQPSGDEVHRLVWVDHQDKAAVAAHVDRLVAEMQQRIGNEHHRHAVLITLLEKMLANPTVVQVPVEISVSERKHA